jgi:hypothetical protein
MTIEISEELERVLEAKALIAGVPAEAYAVQLLERDLGSGGRADRKRLGLKTSYGAAAAFGPAPSAEEIDENRREMFKNFGEVF